MPLDTAAFDDPPPDSPDPYDSSSPAAVTRELPSHININSLPRGLPVLGPLTGFPQSRFIRNICDRYAHISANIDRPLTRDEQSAIAYHTSKTMSLASWGPSLGFGAGYYRYWRTREEMRLPFFGQLRSGEIGKGVFDGESVRVAGREILKSLSLKNKVRTLNLFRGSMYVMLGGTIGPMLVTGYAATVGAVGELRDERLRNVTKIMRKKRMDQSGALSNQRSGGRPGDSDDQESNTMDELQKQPADSGQTKRDDEDDMSPTSGRAFDLTEDEDRGIRQLGGSDTGLLEDEDMQSREARAQPRRGMPSGRPGTNRMQKVAKRPHGFGDDFDDASPTAGSDNSASKGGSGVSAWDRVRMQSTGGSSRPTSSVEDRMARRQQEVVERDADRESFSFGNRDAEKTFAKDQAQRDFDEQVEKERRGGDFDSGRRK